MISKPLHPSQVVNEEEQTVTIQVKPNKELDQMIFSFIPDIEVVSPLFLREEIQKKIEENNSVTLSLVISIMISFYVCN